MAILMKYFLKKKTDRVLDGLVTTTLDGQQILKICRKIHAVVQRYIPKVCNNHVQYFTYGVCIKSKLINSQMDIYTTHFFTLYDYLSENVKRNSFIHFNDNMFELHLQL